MGPHVKSPHAEEVEAVLADLRTSPEGLSSDQARQRLERVGPNRLPTRQAPPLWRVLLRQFDNPLIYVLLAAAVVSLVVGELVDAAFIFAVLVLNALIGGIQEWQAEKSSQALQKMLRIRAVVLRDGHAREVDADDVVPGDIVRLESGNRVPADLRLIRSKGLEIDASLLTGESLPVPRRADVIVPVDAGVGDLENLAHAGTVVVRGRATGVVVRTGAATEVGRLAKDVAGATSAKAPLVIRMERFTRTIAVAVLVVTGLVAVIGVAQQSLGLVEVFLFAVALAVSAIPEGLPVSMTVALSVGTRRMARRGVIVRQLAAVEGLGSCTYIASDKTGTLTRNAMTVRRLVLPDGTAVAPEDAADEPRAMAIVRAVTLCNEAELEETDDGWRGQGDPTEVALLELARDLGVFREALVLEYPERSRVPFESERRYAVTTHEVDGAPVLFVKGAPEVVTGMARGADVAPAEALAKAGYRVLAVASGPGDEDAPEGLDLLGFVGLIDPPRPGVQEAVARCRRAGIRVAMVTGDHPVTALAIAEQLDLASGPDEVMSGDELASLGDDALPRIAREVRVFARVSPEQKLDIVRALRDAGELVAVTGDGVNDAPALRAANIAVAMGRAGTDVAREASDLVIGDDDFTTIVAGVEEGRVAFDNVRKVVFLLVSTGAAEVVLVLGALLSGLPVPLLPAQLLWLNLVTNGIQDKALAFEPAETDVLARPPRPADQPIFDRLMVERVLLTAFVMGGVAWGAFSWLLGTGMAEAEARNVVLLLMVLFETAQIGNARSETRSVFRLSPLRSPFLVTGALLALGVHIAALYVPFLQGVLETEPVSWRTWATLAGLALSATVVSELHKAVRWRRGRGQRRRGCDEEGPDRG